MKGLAQVIFVEAAGKRHAATAVPGSTAMEAALRSGIDGIVADCGGQCSCATCHVYVDAAWTAVVGPAAVAEDYLLELVPNRRECSRLSCQIVVAPELDGLVLHVPTRQR